MTTHLTLRRFRKELQNVRKFSIFSGTKQDSWALVNGGGVRNFCTFYDWKDERKLTTLELQHKARNGEKLAMITAYDYPSGRHAEDSGFDILLVGDSLGKKY